MLPCGRGAGEKSAREPASIPSYLFCLTWDKSEPNCSLLLSTKRGKKLKKKKPRGENVLNRCRHLPELLNCLIKKPTSICFYSKRSPKITYAIHYKLFSQSCQVLFLSGIPLLRYQEKLSWVARSSVHSRPSLKIIVRYDCHRILNILLVQADSLSHNKRNSFLAHKGPISDGNHLPAVAMI